MAALAAAAASAWSQQTIKEFGPLVAALPPRVLSVREGYLDRGVVDPAAQCTHRGLKTYLSNRPRTPR
jgi:hypothetical protein